MDVLPCVFRIRPAIVVEGEKFHEWDVTYIDE